MNAVSTHPRATSSFILILLFAGFTATAMSQLAKPFPQGLGIEVGGGSNSATWDVNPAFQSYGSTHVTRSQFSFTPTVRLTYMLTPTEQIGLLPFLEYNRFGGKHEPLANGYQDEIWFDALAIGFITTYSVSDFSLGVGPKLNRHLRVIERSLGAVNIPSTDGEQWHEGDYTNLYRSWSFDLGVRAAWNVANWSIAGEVWFGLTQLESKEFDPSVDVYQRHFRVLVGYRI